ncbi:hypothetical protein NERG_02227 [Nematocida ausubeli]|uniref:Biotin carboxylase n=1 Tax=Nematocida ausubeli (strain ATCC PRA-371 / ERTm2) TaxID=1913371 RepID=H8ZF58_NEMA1|nr:hypothetical protein NERG_02227 [Nematocida ausubeli]
MVRVMHENNALDAFISELGGTYAGNRIFIGNNSLAAFKFIISMEDFSYRRFGKSVFEFYGIERPSDRTSRSKYLDMLSGYIEVHTEDLQDSFKSADIICQSALHFNCKFVWPGWGHASEDPDLPRACTKHNLIFIGPDTSAMELLGSKISANKVADTAGIMAIPWIDIVHMDKLQDFCETAGYPIMVKSPEGGGGKGIRIANTQQEVQTAIKTVQDETGTKEVFLTKYLRNIKHIELQIIADKYGTVEVLSTRDCTLQRRNQKLIEEGPALLEKKKEEEIIHKAKRLIEIAKYENACTVEFVYDLDGDQIFFLECNPRLQVEHTVTELLIDSNICAVQWLISCGVSVTKLKECSIIKEYTGDKYVVGARIIAESAECMFMPSTGSLSVVSSLPAGTVGYFSVDTGYITPYNDSQFGHVFGIGSTREEAVYALDLALKSVKITGEVKNLNHFLRDLISTDEFHENKHTTRTAERFLQEWVKLSVVDPFFILAFCAISVHCKELSNMSMVFQVGGVHVSADVCRMDSSVYGIVINSGISVMEILSLCDDKYRIKGRQGEIHVVYFSEAKMYTEIHTSQKTVRFMRGACGNEVRATVPGRVVRILKEGSVKKDEDYLEIESMKNLIRIKAPKSGSISYSVQVGEVVEVGDTLGSIIGDAGEDEVINYTERITFRNTSKDYTLNIFKGYRVPEGLLLYDEKTMASALQEFSAYEGADAPAANKYIMECMDVLQKSKNIMRFKEPLNMLKERLLRHGVSQGSISILQKIHRLHCKIEEEIVSRLKEFKGLKKMKEDGQEEGSLRDPLMEGEQDTLSKDTLEGDGLKSDGLKGEQELKNVTLNKDTLSKDSKKPALEDTKNKDTLEDSTLNKDTLEDKGQDNTLKDVTSQESPNISLSPNTLSDDNLLVGAFYADEPERTELLRAWGKRVFEGSDLEVSHVEISPELGLVTKISVRVDGTTRIFYLLEALHENIPDINEAPEGNMSIISCLKENTPDFTVIYISEAGVSYLSHRNGLTAWDIDIFHMEMDRLELPSEIKMHCKRPDYILGSRKVLIYKLTDKIVAYSGVSGEVIKSGLSPVINEVLFGYALTGANMPLIWHVHVTDTVEYSDAMMAYFKEGLLTEYVHMSGYKCIWKVEGKFLKEGQFHVQLNNEKGFPEVYMEIMGAQIFYRIGAYTVQSSRYTDVSVDEFLPEYYSQEMLQTSRTKARLLGTICIYDAALLLSIFMKDISGDVKVAQIENKKEAAIFGWRFTSDGFDFIFLGNDITVKNGAFSIDEGNYFSECARLAGDYKIPFVYVSSNSGAKIEVLEVIKSLIKYDNTLDVVYMEKDKYEALKDKEIVEVLEREINGRNVFEITEIMGNYGMGVENLSYSAQIAKDMARLYKSVPTMTYVTGRAVGIGAYLASIGGRTIQKIDAPIILTGYNALNSLLQKEIYKNNLEIGGPSILAKNGVVHKKVDSDASGIYQVLRWLMYLRTEKVQSEQSQTEQVQTDECEKMHSEQVHSEQEQCEKPQTEESEQVQSKPKTSEPENSQTEKVQSEEQNDLQVESFTAEEVVDYISDINGFTEYLEDWAPNVRIGRSVVGNIPCGIIFPRTGSVHRSLPAPEAVNSGFVPSSVVQTLWTENVLLSESAKKIAHAIQSFSLESLPIIILLNWKGFSAGHLDMFNGVLQNGSEIVRSMEDSDSKIFTYLPPKAELRGGSWVVFDKKIGNKIKSAAHPTAKGSVIHPDGLSKIKCKQEELAAILEESQIPFSKIDASKLAQRFCDLHDSSKRMIKMHVIDEIINVSELRAAIIEYFME